MSYDFSVAVTVSLDVNERTQVFFYEMMAQLMRLKGVPGMPPAPAALPLQAKAVEQKAAAKAEPAEQKAEPPKAEAQNTVAEHDATKPAEEKPTEEQPAEELVTQEQMVGLRQKVVAFCQAGGDKNKALFAAWLAKHSLNRLTDIKTVAQATELEEVLSA